MSEPGPDPSSVSERQQPAAAKNPGRTHRWIAAHAQLFAKRFRRTAPAPTRPRIPIRRTLPPPRRALTGKRVAWLGAGLIVIAIAVFLRKPATIFWPKLSALRIAALSWTSTHPPPLPEIPLPEILLVIGFLLVLALWILPKRQASRSQWLTADNRFDRENEARKTLAQIIAGVLVLAGLYSSVQTFTLQREGQITDRFSKAIEQLGAVNSDAKPKLEVRLGAIYALERIAVDSERDHWPIIEVLTAYVRENSPAKNDGSKKTSTNASGKNPLQGQDVAQLPRLRPDIQAILTVIGRRNTKYDPAGRRVDLSMADLRGAYLIGAKITGAINLKPP